MYCKKCGKELPKGHFVCENCKAKNVMSKEFFKYFGQKIKGKIHFNITKKKVAIMLSAISVIIASVVLYNIFHIETVVTEAQDPQTELSGGGISTDGGIYYLITNYWLDADSFIIEMEVHNNSMLEISIPSQFGSRFSFIDLGKNEKCVYDEETVQILRDKYMQKTIVNIVTTMKPNTKILQYLAYKIPYNTYKFRLYVPAFGIKQDIDHPKKLYAIDFDLTK